MRRLTMGLVATILALATPAGARTAFAHGGRYRGPHGEVPPDSRQPEDPPPPDTGGGGTSTPPDTGGGSTPTPPDTGGGGTPTDPGGTPDGTGGGGGGVPQPPKTGGGTRTGPRLPARKGPSYDSWLFWWHHNKDGILDLRRSLRLGRDASSGGLGEMAGDGGNAAEEQNVTARAVEAQVVPVLQEFARDSKVNFDIQASGVLGLAKIGRRDQIPLLMRMAGGAGKDPYDPVVEETAALALGVLQDRSPEVRRFLAGIAADRGARVRTRCFAAFALGLLGERDAATGAGAESLEVLRSVAADAEEGSRDIAAAAFVGIGLLGDRSAVPWLVECLDEEKAGSNGLDDLQLSYAAAALGRIGRPGFAGPGSREVIAALRAQLTRRHRLTRQSAVIALGQIAPGADERIQKECVTILAQIAGAEGKGGFDAQSANFALISLGRIAGAAAGPDGGGGCPDGVRATALEALGEAFEGNGSGRSFAALGLGLALMHRNETLKAPYAERIRNTLAKSSGDVEQCGALCISLGLLKDVRAAGLLEDLLQDRRLDKKLRGTAALALGLIGERGAVAAVRRALTEKEDRELRVDAAVAAGLLRDNEAVPGLVDILKDPTSIQVVLGSAAMALGQIGDQRAVEPLVRILKDERKQYPVLTRALACVALGQIGDRSDVPVLSRLSTDVNYRAYFDAIGEVLTIL